MTRCTHCSSNENYGRTFVGIYIVMPSEKYKIVSWNKKEFEDLEYFLVSFRLYFVIIKDSSCISTMYYLLLQIYVVLIVKKI
jgi:hypothetical protein